jgi:hypothetical protein
MIAKMAKPNIIHLRQDARSIFEAGRSEFFAMASIRGDSPTPYSRSKIRKIKGLDQSGIKFRSKWDRTAIQVIENNAPTTRGAVTS